MKLTKAVDYALVLLKHLNSIENGKITSVKKVAATCHIPERFLANIVNSLARAGIVLTIKGMDGGIRLAKTGDKISIKDVIVAVDGNIRLVDCQIHEGMCCTEDVCTVKDFWNTQLERFITTLNNTTVEDLSNFNRKN